MHSLSSSGSSALKQKHSGVIELELRDISQLFNSMDPSPLENKDLSDDVEEFIVSWSEEYRPDQALTLRIYLQECPAEIVSTTTLPTALILIISPFGV
jgi:hypothetical protein